MNFDQNFRSKKSSKSSNFDDFYVKIIDFDEISKKKSPAAGTLIGNLLERRAGLRRPTASGLKCAEKIDFFKICGFRYTNFEKISKSSKVAFFSCKWIQLNDNSFLSIMYIVNNQYEFSPVRGFFKDKFFISNFEPPLGIIMVPHIDPGVNSPRIRIHSIQ